MVFNYRFFIAGLCDFTITFYLYIFLSMDFLSEINYMYVCMYLYAYLFTDQFTVCSAYRCECRCVSSCLISGGTSCRRTGKDRVACRSGWVGEWTVLTTSWSTCHTDDTQSCGRCCVLLGVDWDSLHGRTSSDKCYTRTAVDRRCALAARVPTPHQH